MTPADGAPTFHKAPRFNTVVFDCDSTLSGIEGIDELAGGHRDAIAALTEQAMRGELPLEAVYGHRLTLLRPSRAAIDALGRAYIAAAVPDAREVVASLRTHGVDVRILSGGIRQAILPFAAWLGVPEPCVAAVDIHFHDDGTYAGFDARSPLARSGGKPEVLRQWGPMPGPVLMVGDGVTDLEARPVVDAFAAYVGVVERTSVVAAADIVLRAPSLRPLLSVVFPDAEPHAPPARHL